MGDVMEARSEPLAEEAERTAFGWDGICTPPPGSAVKLTWIVGALGDGIGGRCICPVRLGGAGSLPSRNDSSIPSDPRAAVTDVLAVESAAPVVPVRRALCMAVSMWGGDAVREMEAAASSGLEKAHALGTSTLVVPACCCPELEAVSMLGIPTLHPETILCDGARLMRCIGCGGSSPCFEGVQMISDRSYGCPPCRQIR